jgi:hypothetical protein
LGFYRAVTELQKDLFPRLPEPDTTNTGFLIRFFPSLLELVEKKGLRIWVHGRC